MSFTISQLTPKGTALGATDILEIETPIGGGLYETKSVTGQNIKDFAGGAGTVKKIALQTTYGTAITSTTSEVASVSILIPANTIPANCILDLSWMMERTLSSNNTSFTRCYINTSNTLTGATLLATGQITTSLLTGRHIRHISVNGSTWRIANAVQILTSDLSYGTTVLSNVTMATNQDIYLIFSVQNGNTSTTSQIAFASLLSYE